VENIAARTDGPAPLSVGTDEKGVRWCRWDKEELKNYVLNNPAVVFEVKDREGRFFKYQSTSVILDWMASGEFPF